MSVFEQSIRIFFTRVNPSRLQDLESSVHCMKWISLQTNQRRKQYQVVRTHRVHVLISGNGINLSSKSSLRLTQRVANQASSTNVLKILDARERDENNCQEGFEDPTCLVSTRVIFWKMWKLIISLNNSGGREQFGSMIVE